MIKAGVDIIDISPKVGVQLAGYPHCPRPNEGIHDSLFATALYLSDGISEIIFITLDILSIGKDVVKELREHTKKNIFFSATHTHSGAWGSEPLASEHAEGIVRNPEYIADLKQKLLKIIKNASNNTFFAKVGTYIGKCGAAQGVGGNRREFGGIADESVNVLAVKDMSEKVRAVLVNYSLHPTFLHAENVLASADYPAYIRQYFKFAKKDAAVLFAQGTSGDQSSRYFRDGQNFEEAARAGTIIACEADRCLDLIEYRDDFKISVKSVEIDDLPMKKYPQLKDALNAKIKAEQNFEQSKTEDYITMRNAELAMFGAQNTYYFSQMAAEGYKSPELPYEVMFVSIGDTLIVGLQGELFVEYGLEIKNLSPYKKTFVFSVSNGYAPGYLYTPEAGKEGGYEVGTSMFSDQAGEHLLSTIRRELNV